MPSRRRNRRRRTAEEMRSFIAAWKKSGLTQREFARREGVPLSTLTWWRGKLKEEAAAASSPSPRPVPIELIPRSVPAPSAGSREAFEVELRSGHVVRVPSGFDGDALGRLVAALESA